MKICLFRAFPDPYRKSMQIYADQLRDRLAPLLRAGDQIDECLPPNVRLRPRLQRYWDQYLRYQQYARSRHGDVNHVIDHAYGHLVRSLPHQTAVVTFHDSIVTKISGVSLTTRLSLRYSLRAMCRAARIVTDSHVSRNDLLQLIDYPAERLRVVYPGIAPEFQVLADREAHRKALGLPARYLLQIGHNLPYMNVEHPLRVLKLLTDRGFDLKLVKVGARFDERHATLITGLGLQSRVVQRGVVPFSDLPGVYNCAELLLYPVFYAGFGLPPLEAMACGTPVVCSNRGALPEVLGDAAVFAEPEDANQTADRVNELLSNRFQYDLQRARGLERASRFSWDRTAREMLAVYREISEPSASQPLHS
jgi:glycosyltransferase involved in cell wall biosynthesis